MSGSWFYASIGDSGNILFEGDPYNLSPGWTFQGVAPDPTLYPIAITAVTVDEAQSLAGQIAQSGNYAPPSSSAVPSGQPTSLPGIPIVPIVPTLPVPGLTPTTSSQSSSSGTYTGTVAGYFPIVAGVCESGFVWDPTTEMCILPDSAIPCYNPDGTPCDVVSEPPTTTTTTITSGPTTVNVAVSNQVDVANQTLQDIANVLNNGINAAADAAAQTAQDTANEVDQGIDQSVAAVNTQAQGIFGSIQNFMSYLWQGIQSAISGLVTFVTQNIGDAIGKISSAVSNAIPAIVNEVNAVATEVNQINTEVIQPITTFALTTLQTIGTLTTAIEKDLHDGLSGIISIPGDIANGLGSIDASLNRTVQQLGGLNGTLVSTTLGGSADDTIWTRLKGLGANITSVTGSDSRNTTFKTHQSLPEPTISQAGAADIDAIWEEIEQYISSLLSGGTGTIDSLKTALAAVPFLLGDVIEVPVLITIIAGAVITGFLPLFEFVRGDIAAKSGLSKLGQADALAAWKRGFIDNPTLIAELGVLGYDAQRIATLTDLENYLIDTDRIIDMWTRGIVDDADLAANMSQHGISNDDAAALQEAATKKIDINTALTAWRWGIIDDAGLQSILKVNAYTDNEQSLVQATALAPPSSDQIIANERVNAMNLGLQFSDPAFNAVPPELLAAVRREGGDGNVALAKWQASYWVPPIETMLQLYFRGIRTQKELYAVFDYYAVPVQLRMDIVQSHQALIPYRTIPTMLADGIISETYAKQQLAGHGFDLTATEAILNYATLAHTKAKAAASGTLQAQSVSTGKLLWEAGALTDEQYVSILEAHGYDPDTAALVLQTEKMAEQAKQRKQIGVDIANEVTAGLISIDDAKSQMTANNFTMPEQAKVLKSISRIKTISAKTPTEAELRAMVEKNVLQLSDYQVALSQMGYAQKWVDAFVKLYFGSLIGSANQPPVTSGFA